MAKRDDQFEAKYEIDDGYAGASRPQTFRIDDGEIDDDMNDQQLTDVFYRLAEEDMQQRVSVAARNVDDFVEWAKARIAQRAEAE